MSASSVKVIPAGPPSWSPPSRAIVPPSVKTPEKMIAYALQLGPRDKRQILAACKSEHYEMMATFVWTKAMSALRHKLAALGLDFIGMMLARSKGNAIVSADDISEREAIQLAEELGAIGGTLALRLRQCRELIAHFNDTKRWDAEGDAMTPEEAIGCLRTCIQAILGQEALEPSLGFKEFVESLKTKRFEPASPEISQVKSSTYFIKRTALHALLTLLKTSGGAQLSNVSANARVIIPDLWRSLSDIERWEIGRAYAVLVTEGRLEAAIALKHSLLEVDGFTFIPENLRSEVFMKAARDVLEAHEGWDNFAKEAGPMKRLASLGAPIPDPAFSAVMTAALAVKLGNRYGESFDAQAAADQVLKTVSKDEWATYLSRYLSFDETVLAKLLLEKPRARWCKLVTEHDLREEVIEPAKVREGKHIKSLIRASRAKKFDDIEKNVKPLLAYLRGPDA